MAETSGCFLRDESVTTATHSTSCRTPTVELTRWRDFTNASPDQLSYEARSRRSRPTICSAWHGSFKRPLLLDFFRYQCLTVLIDFHLCDFAVAAGNEHQFGVNHFRKESHA